jgi:LysM repeat protein
MKRRALLVVVCGLLFTARLSPGGREADDYGHEGPPETYVVQAGDTLIEIAERLDSTEAALREANGIGPEDNIIKPHQVLIVPAAPVTTSTSSATTSTSTTTSSTTVPSSTTPTISSTEQPLSSTATPAAGERDPSPGQGFPHWPSFLLGLGLVLGVVGFAAAVRRVQPRRRPSPTVRDHLSLLSVDPSVPAPTDPHSPPEPDTPEAAPPSTSASLTEGVEATEAIAVTEEVESAAPGPIVPRRRDRPHPYEVSAEPLRARLLSPPPELSRASAPYLAHAHSLMSPRGLVRVGDHLLVLGEIVDGDEAMAAPGQLLVVET